MKILIIDDEKIILRTLGDFLKEKGYEVYTSQDSEKAISLIEKNNFDCIISDIKMPGKSGIDILKAAKEKNAKTEVLLITAFADISQAVECIKMGAYDYVSKPFLNEEILIKVKRIEEYRNLENENENLKLRLKKRKQKKLIVGKSDKMIKLIGLIKTVAETDANVLIVGESGTGKELIAEEIHKKSKRNKKQLVKVHCSILSENLLEDELFGHEKGAFTDAKSFRIGRFEEANGGTVFLDDIDDLNKNVQVKLLRVLQERTIERIGSNKTIDVDIRVIAATKKDLKDLVLTGKFREDLYYRLNVVNIYVPPLRERKEDIPFLINYFLELHGNGKRYYLDMKTMEKLVEYNWPGNVRQLENAVERAIVLAGDSDKLELEHFGLTDDKSKFKQSMMSLKESIEMFEKEQIRKVLIAVNGEKKKAAQILGISRKTLWEKIKYYKIDVTES